MRNRNFTFHFSLFTFAILALLFTSCIKDLEQEGIYTKSTVVGRVVERTSQQPVAGLTVQLICGDATLSKVATERDGRFALPLTAERQADGCRVVVSADSLYVGWSSTFNLKLKIEN